MKKEEQFTKRRREDKTNSIQLQFHFFISLAREKRNGVELMGLPRCRLVLRLVGWAAGEIKFTSLISSICSFSFSPQPTCAHFVVFVAHEVWFVVWFASFRRSQWRPAALNPPKIHKHKPNQHQSQLRQLHWKDFHFHSSNSIFSYFASGRCSAHSINTNQFFPFSKRRIEFVCWFRSFAALSLFSINHLLHLFVNDWFPVGIAYCYNIFLFHSSTLLNETKRKNWFFVEWRNVGLACSWLLNSPSLISSILSSINYGRRHSAAQKK